VQLSQTAVKSRLHRARLLMRETLGPYFAEKEPASSGAEKKPRI